MSSTGVRKENSTERRIILGRIEDEKAFVESLKPFSSESAVAGFGGSGVSSRPGGTPAGNFLSKAGDFMTGLLGFRPVSITMTNDTIDLTDLDDQSSRIVVAGETIPNDDVKFVKIADPASDIVFFIEGIIGTTLTFKNQDPSPPDALHRKIRTHDGSDFVLTGNQNVLAMYDSVSNEVVLFTAGTGGSSGSGGTGDHLFAMYTADIATANPLPMPTSVVSSSGTSITINSPTTNRVTLQGGKTYKLQGMIAGQASGSDNFSYIWRDDSTATDVGKQGNTRGSSVVAIEGFDDAFAVVTPATTRDYQLRVTGGSGTIESDFSAVYVEEIAGGGGSVGYPLNDVPVLDHGSPSATESFDLSLSTAHSHLVTVDKNFTATFDNPPASLNQIEFEIEFVNVGTTTTYTVTLPSSVRQLSSITIPATNPASRGVYIFRTNEGGVNYDVIQVVRGTTGTGSGSAWSTFPAIQVVDMDSNSFNNYVGWIAAAGQTLDVGVNGLTANLPNGDSYLFRVNGVDQIEIEENALNLHAHSLTNFNGWTGSTPGQTLVADATGLRWTIPIGDIFNFRINATDQLSIAAGAIGMNSPLSMNSNKITSVTDGTAPNDAVNKSQLDAITAPFDDATPIVKGSVDDTKRIRFEVDGLTAATTRVITPLDEDMTLVGETNTQELSNKTLDAPLIKDTDGTPTANRKLDVKDGILGTYSGAVETRAISNSSLVPLVNADISGIAAIDKTKIDGFASGGRWQKGDITTVAVYTDQVNNFTQQQAFGGSGTSLVVTNGANFNGEVNFNDTIATNIEISDGNAVKGETGANIGHLVNDDGGTIGSLGTVQIPISTTGIASASIANSRFGAIDGAMGLLDTGSGSPTLYIRQDDGNWCAVVMTRDSLT